MYHDGTICAIFTYVKNNHGGVLLLVKYKWYQIAQNRKFNHSGNIGNKNTKAQLKNIKNIFYSTYRILFGDFSGFCKSVFLVIN